MEFKTLYKGDYVSLISPVDTPYECLHEKDNVIILPIIENKVGIRFEYCPPYFIKDQIRNYYTVISGGKDEDNIKDTALRELQEEAGIIIKKAKLYRLYENIGFVKNTDMRSSLVLLLISEYEKETPEGDGTKNEEKSKTLWVTIEELKEILKKDNIDSLLWFCSHVIEKVFSSNKKMAWAEPPSPYITSPTEITYWDNYIDEDPWTDDSTTVEDLVMSADIILRRYMEDAPDGDLEEMRHNYYSKIIPLAISYLKIKGSINMGVLEAMIMQNL